MEKLLSTRKNYPTPHEVDRVLNMNPEFTWDIRQFVNIYIISDGRTQKRETEKYLHS